MLFIKNIVAANCVCSSNQWYHIQIFHFNLKFVCFLWFFPLWKLYCDWEPLKRLLISNNSFQNDHKNCALNNLCLPPYNQINRFFLFFGFRVIISSRKQKPNVHQSFCVFGNVMFDQRIMIRFRKWALQIKKKKLKTNYTQNK